MEEAGKDNHWVEELFPPTFTYTLDGILNEPLPDVTVEEIFSKDQKDGEDDTAVTDKKKKHGASDKMTLFDQLARQIKPGDVESIKNVYERMWLMVKLEQEEKLKKEQSQYLNFNKKIKKIYNILQLCLFNCVRLLLFFNKEFNFL